MRSPLLALTILASTACRDHGARAPKPSADARDSIGAPAPAAPKSSANVDRSRLITAVFEDEVERTPRAPARAAPANPAPKPPVDLSRITSSLASQLADRGGIQWSASRPLQWSDFQGTPEDGGRAAALSETGQISGTACVGTQFQYGVIAAFSPSGSWVRPPVLENPQMSAVALAHERLHFDISEIIVRELRQKFATVAKPCDMSDAERDAMGAAAFAEEQRTQQRYDDETKHGLDAAAQGRWAGWAVASLEQLQAFSAPVGSRDP